MRTREEITKNSTKDIGFAMEEAILETLLDCRDLLTKLTEKV